MQLKQYYSGPLLNKALLIGGAFAVVYILWALISKQKLVSLGPTPKGVLDRADAPTRPDTAENSPALREAFQSIANKYGVEYARNIERSVRWESGHFRSGQWLKCGAAGIVAANKTFPYGWTSIQRWIESEGLNLGPSDFYLVHFANTSEGPLNYVAFPSGALGVRFQAWFIHHVRNGNIGAWAGLTTAAQNEYLNYISGVAARFV